MLGAIACLYGGEIMALPAGLYSKLLLSTSTLLPVAEKSTLAFCQ